MSTSFDNFQKRRVISSYFSVVLSIFLVLFLTGMLALFLINSRKIANDFKEDIAMTVFLKKEANDSIIKSFGHLLNKTAFVKKYVYVSKEAAAKQHVAVIGEDFMQFLGDNPLQNSYDINLKASYVNKKNILSIETYLRKNPMVADIVYDKQLVNLVNDNIQKVSFWMLVISGVFAFIAVLLINSSLRLAIHSKRFIIKTMQMVGATKGFIRKPFIIKSMTLGLIGALLAVVALFFTLTYLESSLSLGLLDNKMMIANVFLGVILMGVLITGVSTYFATQRFLNLRTDDLY
ncbi:cell division protein FtsX [Flavobacterium branchiophilum NBRC 15030 = ATCC 35035]|uniref:Cell division protein FtsX n=1 Tax=Flavobacterium branchiophilum TaxID=55197 RepID=A0A543G216_9FLAO|nr:permease-like cell division protein FtsX [Flavobacterium branchiophilum]OXA77768.1 cell division protein FtsX [Flavobacterium branchiophilum NBRC 15030 = ATCC 35035]TQM40074.1 cell division protein FtsX [Flavobacterium branchiophilum]